MEEKNEMSKNLILPNKKRLSERVRSLFQTACFHRTALILSIYPATETPMGRRRAEVPLGKTIFFTKSAEVVLWKAQWPA